jgi:hypothetical protein
LAEEDRVQIREKMDRVIEPREYFYCCNGIVIKTLQELPDFLEKADSQQFYLHVTEWKNDFAKWVYDVFGLPDLASLLGPVKSKEETVRIIRAYIAANTLPPAEIKLPEKPEEVKQIKPVEEPKPVSQEIPIAKADKFQEVSKLKSALPPQKASEEKVSQRIIDLIAKLEEKVEAKLKKPMPLPPKELPRIKPPKIKTEPLLKDEIEKEKKFVLPEIKRPDGKQFDSKIKEIEERLKRETQSVQFKPEAAEEKKPEPTPIVQEIKQESKPEPKVEPPKAVEEPKPEIKKQPLTFEVKQNESDKINEPDKYFEKNPVTITQFVDARKQNIPFEKLNTVKYLGNEQPNELIELFRNSYARVYQQMVAMRKAAYDTSIVEIMVARIPSKIKIYEASQEERDTIPVKRYLNEAIEELNNLK